MRLSTLFTAIVGLSVTLFTITLLTALSYPPNVALRTVASSVGSTPNPVTSPPHCERFVNRSTRAVVLPQTPPWEVLLNDSLNRSTLYVHVFAAQTRRLGNQLFNYASLFGIAWNNNVIPLWPDARTHLRTVFNIRIPIDQHNAIITVSITRHVYSFVD